MKTKKGFTMIELISVIALLGIILIIVGTKGFGAFDNTKEKINIENENTIKEAANFLMTEVKSCEGNEDIYENLINGSFDSEITSCEKLKEKATKKVDGSGCLNISLKYLIDNNYITSDSVKEINDKYSNYTIQGCLEEEKILIALPEKETLKHKVPIITYNGETEFIQIKKTLDLNMLHEKITCTVDKNNKNCSYLKATVYSGEGDNKVIYYEGEFNEFDGYKLSLNSSNIKYGKQTDKILGNKDTEHGTFKLEIKAKDSYGVETTNVTTYDIDGEAIINDYVDLNVYSVEGYRPTIEYNYLTEFFYEPENSYGNNLYVDNILYQIDNRNIICIDSEGNECESIQYRIIDSNNEVIYERSYKYANAATELIKGVDGTHLKPDTYTLEIIGKDNDGVEGYNILKLYVLEYPYDYTINFYGSYYFEDNIIDTSQLYIECINKDGNGCNDWFYDIRYNGSFIETIYPGDNKLINAEEGNYDITIYAVDEFGKVTEEYIYDAFYVYSPCGEYVEECNKEIYDNSHYEWNCTDNEVCNEHPMTYCDWDNCIDVCCWDSTDWTCSTETSCEEEWVNDYEEINVCEDVWHPKSCIG